LLAEESFAGCQNEEGVAYFLSNHASPHIRRKGKGGRATDSSPALRPSFCRTIALRWLHRHRPPLSARRRACHRCLRREITRCCRLMFRKVGQLLTFHILNSCAMDERIGLMTYMPW
jgi:hypothetical protein